MTSAGAGRVSRGGVLRDVGQSDRHPAQEPRQRGKLPHVRHLPEPRRAAGTAPRTERSRAHAGTASDSAFHSAARSVWTISMAMVMGPTPRCGVMRLAMPSSSAARKSGGAVDADVDDGGAGLDVGSELGEPRAAPFDTRLVRRSPTPKNFLDAPAYPGKPWPAADDPPLLAAQLRSAYIPLGPLRTSRSGASPLPIRARFTNCRYQRKSWRNLAQQPHDRRPYPLPPRTPAHRSPPIRAKPLVRAPTLGKPRPTRCKVALMAGTDPRTRAERRSAGALESEVLASLWATDRPLTPAEIQSGIDGPLAYNTVHTILKRLYDKGLVLRDAEGAARRVPAGEERGRVDRPGDARGVGPGAGSDRCAPAVRDRPEPRGGASPARSARRRVSGVG